MRPKPPEAEPQHELFRSALVNLVDPRHPLVRLAGLIDWERFEAAFGPLYTRRRRPARAADPPHGRPAPAQAHGRPLGRGRLRPLPRQPLCPAVLRRDPLPARPAARPLLDDPLAPAHRRRAARTAACRDARRRRARRRRRAEALRAGDHRHHRPAQGGDAPDRQQAASSAASRSSAASHAGTASRCASPTCASPPGPGARSPG